jgi:hypothetical protein
VPERLVRKNSGAECSSLRQYYATKIVEADQKLAEKMQDVRRLQAQRNELNNKVFVGVEGGIDGRNC